MRFTRDAGPRIEPSGRTMTGRPSSWADLPGVVGDLGRTAPRGRARRRRGASVAGQLWSFETAPATTLVRSVSVARIRRCRAPWPSRIRSPSLSRRTGMPRAHGGLDDRPRAGLREDRSPPGRGAAATSAATSNGRSCTAAWSSREGRIQRQARPTVSSSYSMTTL